MTYQDKAKEWLEKNDPYEVVDPKARQAVVNFASFLDAQDQEHKEECWCGYGYGHAGSCKPQEKPALDDDDIDHAKKKIAEILRKKHEKPCKACMPDRVEPGAILLHTCGYVFPKPTVPCEHKWTKMGVKVGYCRCAKCGVESYNAPTVPVVEELDMSEPIKRDPTIYAFHTREKLNEVIKAVNRLTRNQDKQDK
jgi:hypothetical protein